MYDIKRDPKEKDENLKPIFDAVDKRIDKMFKGNYSRGICHQIWKTKKRILKEEYNIDWNTPAEMNPFTMFD